MPKRTQNIINHFEQIPDYRKDTLNKRHELIDILLIALCAILCGADDWVSIASYGKERKNWLEEFLALPNGIPSHDTFNRVFSRIDPEQFMSCFLAWVKAVFPIMDTQVIAIDGKTLRRSHDNSEAKAAIHMVSAWATQSNLVLGQIKTTEKSNEITAIPELLKRLSLDGCLITIDAMGCQKKIAKCITENNADYLLAVKANQAKLLEGIKKTFEDKQAKAYQRPLIDYTEIEQKNRNRREIRRCWVTASMSKLDTVISTEWAKLDRIVKVESERTDKGKTTIEQRYYILSKALSAQEVIEATRSHWGIENKLHWVLDMAFREDECRVRKSHGAENLARLRHFALNMLKHDKTRKMGIKNKRLTAGWSTSYLLHLLNAGL